MDAPRVQVCCRIRPQTRDEILANGQVVVQTFDNIVKVKTEELFEFDHVFGMEANQNDLYEVVGKHSLNQFFKGSHVCIFAYGQTSSGKTWSLLNSSTEQLGLAPRIISQVYSMTDSVNISFYEIYNEKVNDLLSGKTNLVVRESEKKFYVEDLECQNMTCEQVLTILSSARRKISSTKMNDKSSRSHVVLTIQVNSAKFNIIDLAGSEKMHKSNLISKQSLEESKNINQSLTCLGKVINALSNPSPIHVPYRDSKLTKILSEYLDGDSFVNLLIHLSPSSLNQDESLSTLRFSQGAKHGLNIPKVKEIMTLKTKLKERDDMISKMKHNSHPPLDFTRVLTKISELKKEFQHVKHQVKLWSWKPSIVLKCGWMRVERLGKVDSLWCICYHANPVLSCFSDLKSIQPEMQIKIHDYHFVSSDTMEMAGFYWQSPEMSDWSLAFKFLHKSG